MGHHRDKLDLDGSHTVALRGGEEVGGAADKAANTTNALYVSDRQGLPISITEPKSGKHHDVHEINRSLDQLFGMITNAGISIDDLFLNADAGFDCHDFRRRCKQENVIANVDFNKHTKNDEKYLLDTQLFALRCCIEQTNA